MDHDRASSPRLTGVTGVCLMVVVAATLVAADRGIPTRVADELAFGERMYREGILPSGEPMVAFLQGDIEVDGSMFSCRSCHLTSGLGSLEGTVVTPPVTGRWLREPRLGRGMTESSRSRLPKVFRSRPQRPAYGDEDLAVAIRQGIAPDGHDLNPLMPRYDLDEESMRVLIAYLDSLSAEWSPGVDDDSLWLATVVAGEVSEEDAAAMVGTLRAHVNDHNNEVRREGRRRDTDLFYRQEHWAPYRRIELVEWSLTGPPHTWDAQLRAHYQATPVFAMIGGIADGDWAPVHHFAESQGLPCLFPATDFPVLSDSDFYTVYFSRGYVEEGETAAHFVFGADGRAPDSPVLQVLHDEAAGRALGAGFRQAADRGRATGVSEVVARGTVDADRWRELLSEHPDATVVAWLSAAELAALAEVDAGLRPDRLIASGSLVGEDLGAVPEALRASLLLTHPKALPEDKVRTRLAIERWFEIRELPLTNFELQSKMYFVGWTLAGLLKMIRDEFYRDYLLDQMDMMRDQDYAVAAYPRLSFGPGQRYASKGCYMVRLTAGRTPRMVAVSDWVIHGP